jgi:hypothetical protein
MIKIPYRYDWFELGDFMLSDLNDGYTLCRKLGFVPQSITIGKKEQTSMKHWSYSGAPANYDATKQNFYGLKIHKINRQSHLSFNCKQYERP